MLKTLLSLFWVLIWVLIIIGLAYLFTKYVAGRSKLGGIGAGKGNAVELLARLPVNRDAQLLLVQVGTRYFLLGQSVAGIVNLAEFTEEEAAAWKEQQPPSADGGTPLPFGEALKTAWKQRTKR